MDQRIPASRPPLPKGSLSPVASGRQISAGDHSGLIRTLNARGLQNDPFARALFDDLEVLVDSGDREQRTGAVEFLETLQDSCTWGSRESDAYLSLMGPGSQRIWSALNAIRSDLAQCSVFEAEVGIWRVVHQSSAS
jgi:hypothetical protein